MTDEFHARGGLEPAVRVDGINLVLGPPHHGWVKVSLRLGDFQLICGASTVLNDPLTELLDLALFARDGHSGFRRACLWLEPEGYAVDVRLLSESHALLTVRYDDTFVPPMAGSEMKVAFHCIIERSTLLHGICDGISAVLVAPGALQSATDQSLFERLRAAYERMASSPLTEPSK